MPKENWGREEWPELTSTCWTVAWAYWPETWRSCSISFEPVSWRRLQMKEEIWNERWPRQLVCWQAIFVVKGATSGTLPCLLCWNIVCPALNAQDAITQVKHWMGSSTKPICLVEEIGRSQSCISHWHKPIRLRNVVAVFGWHVKRWPTLAEHDSSNYLQPHDHAVVKDATDLRNMFGFHVISPFLDSFFSRFSRSFSCKSYICAIYVISTYIHLPHIQTKCR